MSRSSREGGRRFSIDEFSIPSQAKLVSTIQDIEVLNVALDAKLKNSSRKVWVAYKRDSRWSAKLDKTLSAYSEALWAGLQAIPVFGGYFMLVKCVLQNPLTGLHKVLRTSFGEDGKHWSVFGASNSNGVMSPLGPGDTQFNYANGRRGAFNADKSLALAQLENDLADMVGNPFGGASGSSALEQRHISMQKNAFQNQEYLTWRSYILKVLESFDEDSWTFYTLAMSVIGMQGVHEGLDDLQGGVFKHNGRLGWGGDKSLKVSSHRSPLHLVVMNYDSREADSRYKASIQKWTNRSGDEFLLYDDETIYRVEAEKAEIVAYYSPVRVSLAETLAEHVHQLVHDQNNGKFDMTPKALRSWGSVSAVVLGTLIPIRVLAAVMPKGIYNARTTLSSKDWARNICALSVFYRVLYAYFNKQFICDDLPSKRSLNFFMGAYSDAYNTAMQYFCHESRAHSHRDPQWLKGTLLDLVQGDPAIATYIVSTYKYKDEFRKGMRITTIMPGLQGFKHLKCCGSDYARDLHRKLSSSVSSDTYSTKQDMSIGQFATMIHTYFEKYFKQGSGSWTPAEHGEHALLHHGIDGRALAPGQSGGLSQSGPVSPHEDLEAAVISVVTDAGVPSGVKRALLAILKILKPPGS